MGTQITRLVNEKKIARYTDAKKPIYIEVKDIDIVRGETIAPDQCVMAKAACRAIPNTIKAFFYMHGVYIATYDPKTKKKKTLRYIPSREARNNIATFDRTGKFVPGKYRLDVPVGSNTLRAIRKRSRKRPGRHKPGQQVIKRKIKAEARGRLQYAYAY
jgi:hypothetical protein